MNNRKKIKTLKRILKHVIIKTRDYFPCLILF